MLTLERLKQVLPEVFETTVAPPVGGVVLAGEPLRLWQETKPKDASKHDYLFTLALLRQGVSREEARALVAKLPAGKMNRDQRGEDYWEATLRSVEKVFTQDEQDLTLVRKLKSKNAFLPESVAALARVFELNRPLYERALRRMRKRLRVAKLEAEVKKEIGKNKSDELDDQSRCVSDGKKIVGWWLKCGDEWTATRFSEFRAILDGRGLPSAGVCDQLSRNPWKLVNVPFGPEEDGRTWNKDAARLTVEPAKGEHPTWLQLLRVVGRGLDAAVANSIWCQTNGVKTGGEYLLFWCASLYQQPLVPLPYLFLFGEQQDAGKSLLHEALALTMEPGYAVANEALKNKQGFNGEIAGAILAAADEIELTASAYARIKLWTTGQWLLVHPKGASAYKIRNSLHFIQTGQSMSSCPMLRGDTRITAIEVWKADEADQIDKQEMLRRLDQEKAGFLEACFAVKLPPMVGRLGVPVLETQAKKGQQTASQSKLELWCEAHPDWVGMTDEVLATSFLATVGGQERHEWDTQRVLREVPAGANWRRRVVLEMVTLASGGPWEGSVSTLLEKVRHLGDGHLESEISFGMFLSRPLPGLTVEQTRSNRCRGVRVKVR